MKGVWRCIKGYEGVEWGVKVAKWAKVGKPNLEEGEKREVEEKEKIPEKGIRLRRFKDWITLAEEDEV